MADLINNSTGNFSSSSTWSLIDPTSFLNSEAAATASTTAFVSSSAFTPGAITIDGLGVKVSAHTNPGSGTFSVRLAIAGVAVTGTTVTINVTDLSIVNASTNDGWVFMKFAAPITLIAATAYTLQMTASVNGTVTLYRDATAANWSRILRTTTNQAVSSGDNFYVTGDYSSAGVNNTYTVTMDNTSSAVTYGASEISVKGILSYGVSSSTNYYLKKAGNLSIYTGGTLNIGTSGSPIPSTSTAKLEFVNGSNVQFGVESRLGSVFNSFGNALSFDRALLTADASIGATSLTTSVSTGWKNGDVLALSSTTRTRTEAESKSLTADASGTTLTISALTNAHSGTSPTQCEIVNLTRNVQIFSLSTTNQTYINIANTANINLQWTEFFNMGSATINKRGIDVTTITGTTVINNCSIHDFNVVSSIGINVTGATSNNFTLNNLVVYNIALNGIAIPATTAVNYTVNNIIVIAACTGTVGTAFSILDLGGTVTNLTATSSQGIGITFTDNAATVGEVFATLNGFTSHSNSTIGISLINIVGVTNNPMGMFSNIVTWRNGTSGIATSNVFTIVIDTINSFGNTTANMIIGGTECDNIYIKNATVNAGVTLTCPIGLNLTGDCHEIYIDSSTFGSTTTHSTGDINVNAVGLFPRIITRNTTLSSPTQVSNPGNMTEGGFISLARLNGTAGNHKTIKKYGTIIPDTVIFNSSGTSTRLTPNNVNSTEKLQGTIRRFAVNNGGTSTVTVFLRKSVVGDGTAYNGNQPRLILRADPAVGVTSDVVLATADNTYNGTWKALVGITPAITDNAAFQIYVDVDGNQGWVNVDDWSVQ